MQTTIEGKRQLVCDHCSSVMGESYYPEKRGSFAVGLKNDDGDYSDNHYCGEGCLRGHLNSRHEAKKAALASEEYKELSFGRNGLVELDFSKPIKLKKTQDKKI